MTDVRLIVAPYDITSFRFGESLGLRYLAARLAQCGISSSVHENMDRWEPIRTEIRSSPILGVSIPFTSMLKLALESLQHEFGCDPDRPFIVLGGHGTSFVWQKIMEECPRVDAVVCFEGEDAFAALCERVLADRKADLSDIPGLVIRDGTGVISTGWPEPITNLDRLPFPYRDEGSRVNGATHCTVLTSRGCSARCTFCQSGFYGNRYHSQPRWRARSVANVLAELTVLRENDYRLFSFVDDDFLGACPAGRIRGEDFASAVENNGPRFLWSMECRADEVDAALFARLKQIGLRHVLIGLDGGNDADLRLYGKGVSTETNRRATRVIRELELNAEFGFILFQPSSTLEGVRSSLAFLRDIPYATYLTLANTLQLYHGGPLVRYFERAALVTEDSLGVTYDFADAKVGSFASYCRSALAPSETICQAIEQLEFRVHEVEAMTGRASVAAQDLFPLRDALSQTLLSLAEDALTAIEQFSAVPDSLAREHQHRLRADCANLEQRVEAARSRVESAAQ